MFIEAHAKKQVDAKGAVAGFVKKEEEAKNPHGDQHVEPVSFLPPKVAAFAPKVDPDAMKKMRDFLKLNSRQSHMFQAVERIPYSYLVDHEAPPIGLYRPKFVAVESSPENTNIIEDHRTAFKTKHW